MHEVIKLYPTAKPVVYADARWRELCQEVPDLQGLAIRYHEEAPSPMSNSGQNARPYYRTFQAIIEEIIAESTNCPGLVALGGFKCVDQLARKEPNIEMKARAIGLSLLPERRRPFFPLTEKSLESSGQFLRKNEMSPGNYFVIAPYTVADKMWRHKDWEGLIEMLHRTTGLPVFVVGHDGYPSFQVPTIREAIGLPLTLVAGLLAQARCFIGLDSGPTHLAACFDVPVVTLNPQGKFPPFLVEANSPYRWTHLTPGVYGNQPINARSVLEIVQKTLTSPAPSRCPLCTRIPYVLGAKNGRVLYLCRCGSMYRESGNMQMEALLVPDTFRQIALPTSREALASLRNSSVIEAGRSLQLSNSDPITVTFEHWSPLEIEPDKLLSGPESHDLWWTWDAVYAFLKHRGWRIIGSRISKSSPDSAALFSVVVKATPASHIDEDVYLHVPWGRRIVKMKRSMYEEWLSWECFQKVEELEGLGWHLANEGEVKAGRKILRLAFTLGGRRRTIERLFRVECRTLWNSLVRK
ncbi:MAG: glycosyltransferase family 9 protein [Acidobacteriota bacterium]